MPLHLFNSEKGIIEDRATTLHGKDLLHDVYERYKVRMTFRI
jgi:hypothetical protein